MSKQIKIYSQEKMGEDILPKAEQTKKTYKSYKEYFEDSEVKDDAKLKFISEVIRFETLNSITKADLHAMLKWIFFENYEFVQIPPDKKAGLRLIKGNQEEV